MELHPGHEFGGVATHESSNLAEVVCVTYEPCRYGTCNIAKVRTI
jgi:hypothetical protein